TGTAPEALPVTADKRRGRGRSAGEDGDRATGCARRRSARSVRDDTSDDARKGAARDCCPFTRTPQIIVLDALLKLRQVCCDPRLVKLAVMRKALSGSGGEAEMPATPVVTSSKLVALIQMLRELASEGRRVLVFSQFTSMLELIKPELATAEIDHVELTGATRDRADPISRFQSGGVPVFLISLKAGGRGLNLT